jgi:outer membrane murein-binding lipoprotein Lpp
VKLIKGILLGIVVLSTSQVTAKADDDAATQIRLLKAQLKKLEQRVDAQSKEAAATRGKLAAVPPPGVYKAQPSVFDPCPPGKVCFKGVTLTPGGWIDLAAIYRSRNLASDTGSVYAFIPFRQAKNFNAQEARFSARQTRFSLLAEADAGANTHLAGYGEIDFEGAAQTASSVATNSFNPRMRQASVEIFRTDLGLHFMAGQSWSLNAPSRVGIDPRGVDAPGVIDFESVPGFLAARQPGIRVWQDIGPDFKVAASAENPQTSFVGGNVPAVGTPAVGPQGVLNPNLLVNLTGPGGSFFNNANNLSLNRVPDVTVKAAWDPMLGANKFHIEGWALYRNFYDHFNFENHDVSNVSFGGHVALEVIPRTLDFTASAAYGALGRFTAAPFSDATLRQDGSIQLLPITAFQAGAVWHTTPSLDLYAYAGLEKTRATFSNVGTVPFGYGNPLYNNTGCNIENSPAATCNGNTSEVRQYTVGFYDTVLKGNFGAIKVGAQYSYNQRFAFAGVGGAPQTDDHIVMTQVRYYPF